MYESTTNNIQIIHLNTSNDDSNNIHSPTIIDENSTALKPKNEQKNLEEEIPAYNKSELEKKMLQKLIIKR